MFLDQFPKLTYEETISVEWKDDPELYDSELSQLAKKFKKCLVINPNLENHKWPFFIEQVPKNSGECIVWNYRDTWVAKLFYKGWKPDKGYIQVKIDPPKLTWRKNPDIDFSMTFFDSPMGNFEPDPWDCEYTMVWYMDKAFNPTDDKIWVMTCEVLGKSTGRIKEMGELCPQVELEFNPELPDFGLEPADLCPPYWDLQYECAYYLDTSHTRNEEEKIWVAKIKPLYRQTKDWKWLGSITPEPSVVYNPALGVHNHGVDLSAVKWSDLKYECMWMLDKSFLPANSEDMWSIKVKWTTESEGLKVIDYVKPEPYYELNSELDHLTFDFTEVENLQIGLDTWHRQRIWYLDESLGKNHKIWIVKKTMTPEFDGAQDCGYMMPEIESELDVFFISYDEPDAEQNWQRVLAKAPNARHIKGVKGIWKAHAKAAKQATTSMFWVIDADCYLSDDWQFDYRPEVFNREFVHVWYSRNPITGLAYGNGGVKLFPKKSILSLNTMPLDMTTSLPTELKIIPKIAAETRFNQNEFLTWRAAFREVSKLSQLSDKDSSERLEAWLTAKKGKFADWAKKGAKDAMDYMMTGNIDKINDYAFLKKHYHSLYGR